MVLVKTMGTRNKSFPYDYILENSRELETSLL